MGGRTECVWMRENMDEVETLKLVEEVPVDSVGEYKLYFSMKFHSKILVWKRW